jgi:hypothetical protein
VSTFSLFPDRPDGSLVDSTSWVDEKIFMSRVQFLGKSLYYEGMRSLKSYLSGDLSYFESVNIETIKNAILRLKEMGIVKSKKARSDSSDSVTTWITLDPSYLPPPLPPTPSPTVVIKKGKRPATDTTPTDSDYLQEWYLFKPSGKLWEFCERIGQYRRYFNLMFLIAGREGKNRRDTQTVATRVLRLSRLSSKWVFDGKSKNHPTPAKL